MRACIRIARARHILYISTDTEYGVSMLKRRESERYMYKYCMDRICGSYTEVLRTEEVA
jgi:hypothetical protein